MLVSLNSKPNIIKFTKALQDKPTAWLEQVSGCLYKVQETIYQYIFNDNKKLNYIEI